jgi:tetratricopeptide (TPR) repeat protein
MMPDADDDLDFQILFYEGVLARKGDFIEALTALGDLYTKKGRCQEGLAIDQRLARLRPDDPYVLYNLACSFSLLGRVDSAYDTMKKAVACGYDDFHFLTHDSDLAALLSDPRFQQFLSQARKKTVPQDH